MLLPLAQGVLTGLALAPPAKFASIPPMLKAVGIPSSYGVFAVLQETWHMDMNSYIDIKPACLNTSTSRFTLRNASSFKYTV